MSQENNNTRPNKTTKTNKTSGQPTKEQQKQKLKKKKKREARKQNPDRTHPKRHQKKVLELEAYDKNLIPTVFTYPEQTESSHRATPFWYGT